MSDGGEDNDHIFRMVGGGSPTGRQSRRPEPEMQGIAPKTREATDLREAMLQDWKDHLGARALEEKDLAGIEHRVVKFMQTMPRGTDAYFEAAAELLGDRELVTPEIREMVKKWTHVSAWEGTRSRIASMVEGTDPRPGPYEARRVEEPNWEVAPVCLNATMTEAQARAVATLLNVMHMRDAAARRARGADPWMPPPGERATSPSTPSPAPRANRKARRATRPSKPG